MRICFKRTDKREKKLECVKKKILKIKYREENVNKQREGNDRATKQREKNTQNE